MKTVEAFRNAFARAGHEGMQVKTGVGGARLERNQ